MIDIRTMIERIKKHIIVYGPLSDEYGNVIDENTVFVGCDLEYSSGLEFHHKPESISMSYSTKGTDK